jgi:hypothetical protein
MKQDAMSKRKLALIIGGCALAISIIAVIIIFLLPRQQAEPPVSLDYGLQFDGIDDYVALGDAAVLGFTSQNFTIEAWIKPDTVTRRMEIFTRHKYNSDGYRFEVHSRGQLAFYTFQSGANQIAFTSLNVLTAGNWSHVAAVRQGTSVRIYVNGVDRTGVPNFHIDPAYMASRSATIGINYEPEAFQGSITEVRVWNYARTESQINTGMYGNFTGSESGLVGYWKLDEGLGTIAHDSTANDNCGALYGNPVWFISGHQQPSTPTPPTCGLEFDGVDDYIALGDATALGFTSENFTIEAWIKPDTVARRMQIFQRHGWNSDGYRFNVASPGRLEFFTFQSDTNQFTITSAGAFAAGSWCHVAIVRQGTSARIYINGVDRTETAGYHIDPAYLPYRLTYIGINYVPEMFAGLISEVRIWNYARTEFQINAGMYGNLMGSESGLVGYWKLDEGSGIIAHDSTANNITGTLVGDPVWFTNGE